MRCFYSLVFVRSAARTIFTLVLVAIGTGGTLLHADADGSDGFGRWLVVDCVNHARYDEHARNRFAAYRFVGGLHGYEDYGSFRGAGLEVGTTRCTAAVMPLPCLISGCVDLELTARTRPQPQL